MTRTNIDIDDTLVAEAMRRFDLATKRDAVDFALRRLVVPTMARAEMLSMEGSGWQGDLDQISTDDVQPL